MHVLILNVLSCEYFAYNSVLHGTRVKKEMGGACDVYGGEQRSIQGSGGET
jgi:hypothetical protein